MWITIVGIVIMHILVCLTPREDTALYLSGMAGLYTLYLQWSAMSSDSD